MIKLNYYDFLLKLILVIDYIIYSYFQKLILMAISLRDLDHVIIKIYLANLFFQMHSFII